MKRTSHFSHMPLICLVLAAFQATPFLPAADTYVDLPGVGQDCRIDGSYHFTYQFSETPTMGMFVLKIQVFDQAGRQVTPFEITGRSDMPSMRGAHDSGEVKFRTNRKGDYLLPLTVVMPGDWEVRLIFKQGEKKIHFARVLFDV